MLEKYNENDEDIPIITYVIYPFRMPQGEPGVLEEFEDEELLRFRHREIHLRKLDARLCTQAHAVPLYGLLPAMDCTSERLLNEAIDDMVQYYKSREDDDHLRDELLCFQTLLQRAKRLPAVQTKNVLRRIRMFDSLLREDPWVQEYGDEREAGGEVKGRVEATRYNIIMLVHARFPALAELVVGRVEQIPNLEALQKILMAVSTAQDESHARRDFLILQDGQ